MALSTKEYNANVIQTKAQILDMLGGQVGIREGFEKKDSASNIERNIVGIAGSFATLGFLLPTPYAIGLGVVGVYTAMYSGYHKVCAEVAQLGQNALTNLYLYLEKRPEIQEVDVTFSFLEWENTSQGRFRAVQGSSYKINRIKANGYWMGA
jgi:hypothetical protein